MILNKEISVIHKQDPAMTKIPHLEYVHYSCIFFD